MDGVLESPSISLQVRIPLQVQNPLQVEIFLSLGNDPSSLERPELKGAGVPCPTPARGREKNYPASRLGRCSHNSRATERFFNGAIARSA